MSIRDKFRTDAGAASSGVWVSYPTNEDGTVPRLLLARTSKQNKKYARALRKATKKFSSDTTGELDLGEMSDEDAEAMMLDVFVDTVLLNWENLQPEDDGVNLEYSKENAKTLFGDPDWADFYEAVQKRAGKATTFNIKKAEAEAKN